MSILVDLLRHAGVPSGAAFVLVIVGKKVLRGGSAGAGKRRDRKDRSQ